MPKIDDRDLSERAARLAYALDQSVLDAVAEIMLWNRRKGRAVSISLDELLSKFSDIEIADASRRTNLLIGGAEAVGDAFHDRAPDYKERERSFRQKHPGFSDRTYERALDYGLFVTR